MGFWLKGLGFRVMGFRVLDFLCFGFEDRILRFVLSEGFTGLLKLFRGFRALVAEV